MLIQYVVDTKASFDSNNKPKDPNTDEAIPYVKKVILAAILRQYIDRESRISSNRNIIYGIIWGQFTPGIQSASKGNED